MSGLSGKMPTKTGSG